MVGAAFADDVWVKVAPVSDLLEVFRGRIGADGAANGVVAEEFMTTSV